MKIKSIESFILKDELEESFYFSQWEYSQRRICIVKVTSDTGHVGWGEGYGPASLVQAGIKHLTPWVLGQHPLETETIWSTLYRRTLDFARKGILVSAISAIDVALWDLKGKILELPVHLLLGGKKRDSITPYATGLYFTHKEKMGEALAKEAQQYGDQGYRAIKMKVALSVDEDVENVRMVPKAIGPDIDLMIDANHAYNLREAIQLAKAVECYNIYWFEEPISPEYYSQHEELRAKTSIPIAGGECEHLRFGFQTLLQHKSVDIIQPDICATGGLSEAKRIATLASVYGVELVPHTWGTGIAIAAATHFVSNLEIMPGRMIAPLEEAGIRENTIIVVWGDHGWHLGEMGIWGKATNYKIATRVPLMIWTPDMPEGSRGRKTEALTELIDIYPTLCELAGLSIPAHLEGKSFAPLLEYPELEWKKAAISQFPNPALREWAANPLSQGMRETYFGPLIQEVEEKIIEQQGEKWDRELYENHLMGYSIRTDRYRLVVWQDLSTPDAEPLFLELYDHEMDPGETLNIASEKPELTSELLALFRAYRIP